MRIANTGHMSPHSHHPLRRQIFGVADDRRVSTYEDAIPPDYLSSTSQPPSPQADAQEVGGRSPALPPQVRIVLEDLVIDVLGREVQRRGRRIQLTFQEFELLRFLAQHRGRVFERRELVRCVWNGRAYISLRTVDIHVHRLRTKLGAPLDRMIETVRQVGYKLSADRGAERAFAPVNGHAVRVRSGG